MKKLISLAIALSVIAPTASFAQQRSDRTSETREVKTAPKAKGKTQKVAVAAKQNGTSHRFSKGERFDRSRAQNYRRIDYRTNTRLSAAPNGYTWVRAGNDALLVRLSNNLVARVVSNIY